MSQKFMKSKLPKVYRRNGQNAYLDPIREKLIYVTPEETVRQHVVSYLLEDLQVPKNLICVEEHLRHYQIKTKVRADIIIDRYDEETNAYYPLAVIECKAPEIFLDDIAHKQMFGYAEKLDCDYCVLTNGEESFCYFFDGKNYIEIDELPTYEEMLQGKYSAAPVEEPEPRLNFDELAKDYKKYIDNENQNIAINTSEEFAIPLTNFLECLFDTEHKFPAKQYKIFKLVEDFGIRNLSIRNSSGLGYFNSYRSFLIEYNENTNFVSLSTSSYGEDSTIICVAVDRDNGNIHHSLQLSVEKNCEIYDLPKNISDAEVEEKLNTYIATLPPKPTGSNILALYLRTQWKEDVRNFEHNLKFMPQLRLFHNGAITSGDKGALKVDGLRELVAEKYPEIIDGKNFYLGTLTHNRLWYLDDPEVIQVVENLISYALIRDDYRALCR